MILEIAISLVIAAPWVVAWIWRRLARRERKARVMDGIVSASQQRGRAKSQLIDHVVEEELAEKRAQAKRALNEQAQARGR